MAQKNNLENRAHRQKRITGIIPTAAMYAAVLLFILCPDILDRAFLQELRYPQMTALMNRMEA